MRRSFALRLTLAFAAVGVGAALLTTLIVNMAFGARFASYLSTQQHQRQSELLGAVAGSYRGHWDPTVLADLAPAADMAGTALSVLDQHGALVWSSTLGSGNQTMAGMHRTMMGLPPLGPLGPPRRLPVIVDGTQVGTAVIAVPAAAVPAADRAFQTSVDRLLVVAGLGVALVALATGAILARRVTAPVRALTDAASALSAGDRSARVARSSLDEIGQMSAAFNTMADTIERDDQLRRSFAGDIAHELRTPLTVLRTQLEAMEDGLAEPTPQAMSSLHDETLRLGRLVGDLETLASSDAATFSLERRTVRLGPVVEAAAADLAGPFADKELSLSLDLGDVAVTGDPNRLVQVVTNLLSNAAKFVPHGGQVRISLEGDGRWVELRVADTGPGIEPDELAHVFDRFFRGHAAKANGSGIGLAVVAGLVRAHNGDVTVTSPPGHGATFTIRLPQTAPNPHAAFAESSLPPHRLPST